MRKYSTVSVKRRTLGSDIAQATCILTCLLGIYTAYAAGQNVADVATWRQIGRYDNSRALLTLDPADMLLVAVSVVFSRVNVVADRLELGRRSSRTPSRRTPRTKRTRESNIPGLPNGY